MKQSIKSTLIKVLLFINKFLNFILRDFKKGGSPDEE